MSPTSKPEHFIGVRTIHYVWLPWPGHRMMRKQLPKPLFAGLHLIFSMTDYVQKTLKAVLALFSILFQGGKARMLEEESNNRL